MPTPSQLAHFLSIAPKTEIRVMALDGEKIIKAVTITTELQCAIVRALMLIEREQKGVAA